MRSGNGRRHLTLLVCLVLLVVLQAVGGSSLRNLSNNSGASLFPAMALSQNNIYLVWEDGTPGNSEIYFVRSADGGQTFSSPQNLSNSPGRSRNPAIAVSGSDVYIVWDDDTLGNFEIFYIVSRDGGQSFSQPQNLSQNAGRSVLPDIAVSENNIYLVWQDDALGNPEIFYVRSTDGGQSFTASLNLSQNLGRSWSPVVAAEGKKVYVVWDDNTPGNREIFYAQSSDGAASFSTPKNISNSSSFSAAPAIAVSGSRVYLAWTEELTTENYEIFYAWSSDGGSSFTLPQNISKSPTYSGLSVIAALGDEMHVAWIEGIVIQKNGKPYVDYEAFYKRKASDGSESVSPQNLSSSEGVTATPAIALSGSNIYVAFADDTPGNFEIFLYISPK